MRLWSIAAFAVIALLALAGCGGDDDEGSAGTGADTTAAASDEPIVVGAAYAQSGLAAGFDGPAFESFKLGIEDINADGGLLDRQVDLITADTRSNLDQARRAGERLVADGAELVVAPCDYDLGSPAALVAEAAGILSFSLCSGSPKWGVQGIGPLSYSPGVAGAVEGFTGAEWAYEDKGWKTAVTLNDTSLSALDEICTGFEQRFTELGGEMVGDLSFQGGTDTVKVDSQISEIKSKNPDVVVLCSYPPGGPAVLRQMRAAGIDTAVLANSSMDGSYWLEAVPNLSDFYYVAPASIFGDDERDGVNQFVDRFTEATGNPPVLALNLSGYLAAELWGQAVEAAGTTDAEAVAAELNQFDGAETLLGPVSYTDEEHIRLNAEQAIMEVQNGKPAFVTLMQAEGTPPLFILGQD